MKKVILGILMVALLSVGVAFAYNGPFAPSDVATIKAQGYDDQYVILQGQLTRQLGHEDFIFQDATGEIYMEVDDDILYAYGDLLNVELRVYGKVDVDHGRIGVDAKQIERL